MKTKKLTLWQELKLRWRSETPDFFKKLKKLALIIGANSMAAIGIMSLLPITFPVIIIQILSYIAVGCAFVAGTSSFAVKS